MHHTGQRTLGRGLDLQLCAEGIETEAQLEVVRRLQFEAAQGFLFARPAASRTMVSAIGAGPGSPLRGGRIPGPDRRGAIIEFFEIDAHGSADLT